jgi:hypothetical protein
MTGIAQRKIKRGTIIIYLTIFLAIGQSIFEELGTTDGGHRILSIYFFIEAVTLGLTLLVGLKNSWTRVIIGALTICEIVLFIQDRPVSPDEILMIVIFGLRVFVLVGLFSRELNQYYKGGK